MIALLLAAYFAFSAYFCAGALHGDFRGCIAMTGDDMLRSPAAQIASLALATGLLWLSIPRRGMR